MKKLMAMIGAVAMSFGLFAATPFSISFEAAESAKGVSDGAFNPNAESVTGWTWAGDPLSLAQYVDEVLPYGSGDMARRDNEFTGLADNNYYLPLETGTDELVREVGTDNIFLDQLVKFTGFEDPQTNLTGTAKIAIWMSEFENEDESTETNLFVTVGKVTGAGVEQIKLAINTNDNYKLNTWYRLTVKSIGGIYSSAVSDSQRAGFLVWINGKPAVCDDEAAKSLTTYSGEMSAVAAKYMAQGRLFTAIDATTDAMFASVGYQGIGAVDDIILDDVGPGFTVETVDVSFAPITGAVIVKVVDSDGTEFDNPDGTISVKPGALTVTLEAAEGYKWIGSGTYAANTDDAEEGVITIDAEDDFVEVYATKNGTVKYGADELYTMITGLVDGDVVLFNKGATIDDGTDDLYAFTANTTIDVTDDDGAITWDVAVSNVEEVAGSFENYVGVDAGDTLNVWFESGDDAFVTLTGNIAGNLKVEVGALLVDSAITVAGTIDAAYLTANEAITLSGSGKVITMTDPQDLEDLIVDGEGAAITPTPDTPEEGWYTYALSDEPEKIDLEFTNLPTDTAVTAVTGETVEGDAEKGWKAEEGDALTITLTAQNGKVFDEDGSTTKTVPATAAEEIDLTEAPAPFAAAVTVVADSVTKYYASADEALEAVEVYTKANPDKRVLVTFNQAVEKAGEYAFDEDVEIEIYTDYDDQTPAAPIHTFWEINGGDVTFLTGLENNKVVTFNADGDEVELTFAGKLKPGALLTADGLVVGNGGIELSLANDTEAASKVVTTAPLAEMNFVNVPAGYTVKTTNAVKEGGTIWYTYELAQLVATVASGSDTFSFLTSAEALDKVQELEADSANFPIVATALVADLAVVGPNGVTIVLAQGETITINANSWVFSGGATISQGPIALAAGATFKVTTQIANYTTVFSAPTGYEVTETDNKDGTYTYSAAQSGAKVAEIVGGDQYATLQAAIEAAQDGDVIKLLSNYTAADTESIIFNDDVTFDLGGYTLTLSNAQREGKKFAMGAEEQGGPDVTITNGVINFVTISGSGASGRGFNVFGGTLTVACTFTQTGDGSSQPVFDIYSTATVNIEPEAVIDALHGDAFRSKGDLNTACFVNINGGSITCPANGVFNTAKPLPLTVTLNGGEISYAGGDLIHSGSSYDAQFICNLDDTCGAKFDTDTAKSAGCGLKDLVAEGYEAVEGEDEWYTIAKIPSFDVTFTVDEEAIPDSATNVLRDTVLTVDMIPDVSSLEGAWDVDPVGAIITETTNFNFTTVKYVTITLPQELPDGVTDLVVSQKVDDVWIEVDDNQIVVGNDWKVEATVADGYTVDNPIKSGTAELGVNITVDASDFTGKIHPPAVKVVEIVGGDQYETLQAAIEAAQDGDVIKLLSNYTAADTESIIFNADVTFDLNDKTLTLSNAQRDGKKFAMGAEEQGGPDVTITNGVIHYVSGGCGRGFNVYGGTLTVACTFEQTAGSSQPVFDIYSTATVNIEPTAVIDAKGGDVFRTKGDLNTACYVNINGGSITCPTNGVFNTAKPLPLTVTLNGGEISYAGGDLIHSGSGYDAQFICNLDDTCGAKFDTDTAKSAGCGLKNLVADGYEAVQGEDEWYTIAKIPSFDVTFTQNNEPIAGSTTNVLRGTALTADMIPAVEGGTWDVNPVGAIITSNTNFNYTVAVGPDWPSDWPADVPPAMKEAFATWADTYKVESFEGVENAFLMNVDPKGTIPALEITSIEVADGVATIKVAAGEKNLKEGINGVLFVSATDDLAGEWATTQVEAPKSYEDEGLTAVFEVEGAQFMKAKVGFKVETPVVKEN